MTGRDLLDELEAQGVAAGVRPVRRRHGLGAGICPPGAGQRWGACRSRSRSDATAGCCSSPRCPVRPPTPTSAGPQVRRGRPLRPLVAAGSVSRSRVDGKSFDESARLDPASFAAHGGAFPILLRGTGCVGTVAVSGRAAARGPPAGRRHDRRPAGSRALNDQRGGLWPRSGPRTARSSSRASVVVAVQLAADRAGRVVGVVHVDVVGLGVGEDPLHLTGSRPLPASPSVRQSAACPSCGHARLTSTGPLVPTAPRWM